MNEKYTKNLNQKVYYISFSHKRISEIMDWIEKNNPSAVADLIKTANKKELVGYNKLAGILLLANIEKIGTKSIRTMKKQEFREKLAAAYDKNDTIKKLLTKNKISKDDIVQSEGQKCFDPIALLKLGFDLSVLD